MMQLRPVECLASLLRAYPVIPEGVDSFRDEKGKDLPDWPDWCFLPMAAWYAMVCEGHNVSELSLQLVGDVSKMAAIGTWRYSQGIYRVDQELLAALTDSPVSGNIPCEVVYRLPEWCIYVETPGRQWLDDELYGFWAHLEWDANTGRSELRFFLDCKRAGIPLALHLGDWSLLEGMERFLAEASRQSGASSLHASLPNDLARELGAQLAPLLSVVLYLCSQEPEIDNAREPGKAPARPGPKKTKKGLRYFPPDKPTIWSVGANTGSLLRQAAADSDGGMTGRSVRSHLRRGHWHGYWTGPRRDQQKAQTFVYRWLSPLVVRGREDETEKEQD